MQPGGDPILVAMVALPATGQGSGLAQDDAEYD